MMRSQPASAGWKSLYRIGGVATLVLIVYSLATMVIMIVLRPPPEAVEEVFAMLQANELVGLLRLDLLTVVCVPLYYLLFLALYIPLRRTNPCLGRKPYPTSGTDLSSSAVISPALGSPPTGLVRRAEYARTDPKTGVKLPATGWSCHFTS
jgi:hypothetical protein